MRSLLWLIAAAALSSVAGPVAAHKMKAFATVEGATLTGYAYFSPGGRVRQAAVTVTAPDGSVLATTRVDENGAFHIEATRRVDHLITVNGGDGHVATYTVAASELPDTLPAAGPQPAVSIPVLLSPASAAEAAHPALSVQETALHALIDQSIARHIRPLREQIDAYQAQVGWRDVLGGLGYIIGISGLAFGLLERRRRTLTSHERIQDLSQPSRNASGR